MSKKIKRQIRRAQGVSIPGEPSSVEVSKPSSFNPDYTYVFKDLRRIGLLAGAFVAILVILAFFLR
jgi:hypothetical protein